MSVSSPHLSSDGLPGRAGDAPFAGVGRAVAATTRPTAGPGASGAGPPTPEGARRRYRLTVIKAVHTAAWFLIESCMGYLLVAGFAGRTDRRAAVAAAVVAGEIAVFTLNGFRCPLTALAEREGAASGSVTDIYLPRWLARNLPAIHVPLVVVAVLLHARNRRGAATGLPGCHRGRGAGQG